MVGEFRKFLKEYGVIGLALGVIIGGKAGELVAAVVDNLLMPVIGLALPGGEWKKWAYGDFKFGLVFAAFINFVVVAMFVFLIAKKLFREETVEKK